MISRVINRLHVVEINLIFILAKTVFKGAYWISPNSSFIQYCDSNIGLLSIAPSSS